MSLLDDLHAAQHDDLVLPADAAFAAFLAEEPIARALLDRTPKTDIEIRHLARTRRAA